MTDLQTTIFDFNQGFVIYTKWWHSKLEEFQAEVLWRILQRRLEYIAALEAAKEGCLDQEVRHRAWCGS